MPRSRKPTELHVIEGTLRSRHKDRQGEPRVDAPLGRPPADFSPELRAAWRELVNALPEGVARRSDRFVVELAARLILQMRTATPGPTPALASQLRACLASLGLTPADRSRVTVPPNDPGAHIEQMFFSHGRNAK